MQLAGRRAGSRAAGLRHTAGLRWRGRAASACAHFRRQRLARGDQDLQPHQVEPGDAFGHRMLDLQPRVDFQEVELAVGRQQKLDRAGVRRSRSPWPPRTAASVIAARSASSSAGDGRFFDDLLMPPLDRALALEQVHDVAVRVAEDLDLDVPRGFDVGLDEQRAVAKGGLRFLARGFQQLGELARPARTMRMPRPPPPAEALIEQRPAERLRPARSTCSADCSPTSTLGSSGTSAACIRRLASIFEPIAAITSAGGPMNVMPACRAGPGEVGILGQKAIAGVNRVAAGLARGVEDGVDRADTTPPAACRPAARLRRPRARTARRDRPRSRRPRSRCPSRGRCA